MFPHQDSNKICEVCQTPNYLNINCANCIINEEIFNQSYSAQQSQDYSEFESETFQLFLSQNSLINDWETEQQSIVNSQQLSSFSDNDDFVNTH